MPINTGMAFIIVTHLKLYSNITLDLIISRHTWMPVIVTETWLPILKNQVYVIPQNTNLLIEKLSFKDKIIIT
jgi:two-component system CheB/CheR fusion protein